MGKHQEALERAIVTACTCLLMCVVCSCAFSSMMAESLDIIPEKNLGMCLHTCLYHVNDQTESTLNFLLQIEQSAL